MSSSNLKQNYMDDAILLQFASIYLSVLLFNEATKSSKVKDMEDAKDILNTLLNLNESIKKEGQESQILKFTEEVNKISCLNKNGFKCIKDFIVKYLSEDNAYDNLKYLLEIKIIPSIFQKEYSAYEKYKKSGKNDAISGILENIISNFQKNTKIQEQMYFSYINFFDGKKLKNRTELEKELSEFSLKLKNNNIEKDRLLTEKNNKIKNANIKIAELQEKEKNQKKKRKSLKQRK